MLTPLLKKTCQSAPLVGSDGLAFIYPEADKKQPVCHMVSAITTLAILSADVLHIKIEYAPEFASLTVKAFNVSTSYTGGWKSMFSRCVYLDQPSSILQLKTLEDDLIELVGLAKDKLMGAV